MKQNKGISQIAVMVIMLVLAIALPITTKLVQKSQENRSKAAGGLGYAEVCKLDSDCKPPTGQTSGFCTNTTQHTTNWPSFSKGDAPPVCSYGWGNKDEQRRNEACFLVGGSCSEPYSASWGNNCKTDKGVDGVVVWNLCLANPYLGTARCCVPDTVYAQLGDANKTTVTSKPSDLLACKKGSVVWVDGQATDGIYNWKCVGYEGKVSVEGSANKTACVPNTKECLDADTARVCKSDGSGWINSECGTAGCNSTTKICNTVAPTATPTIKPTATPTIKPTATPTIKPTGRITPTPTPTLTPTPVLVC
ncbi:MAG: PT domain-containing protein, partial [Candidatus Shapirobacteria bacterium]|nr:PT domain-containing protein [Candidatus Shapirobacteria bacterium]